MALRFMATFTTSTSLTPLLVLMFWGHAELVTIPGASFMQLVVQAILSAGLVQTLNNL